MPGGMSGSPDGRGYVVPPRHNVSLGMLKLHPTALPRRDRPVGEI